MQDVAGLGIEARAQVVDFAGRYTEALAVAECVAARSTPAMLAFAELPGAIVREPNRARRQSTNPPHY
jgi:hypothetical protein